jgi:hypothetical protein
MDEIIRAVFESILAHDASVELVSLDLDPRNPEDSALLVRVTCHTCNDAQQTMRIPLEQWRTVLQDATEGLKKINEINKAEDIHRKAKEN